MVLKKGKHGITRGSTFCHHCCNKNAHEGWICKFALGQPCCREDRNTAVENLSEYLHDGGMVHSYDHLSGNNVQYSLNKRQRWRLVEHIEELVNRPDVEEDDFRLVLHERTGVSSAGKTMSISYCDSRHDVSRRQAHHVTVPEVRYEITYPDKFNTYCQCPKKETKRRWEVNTKGFGWKTKGNRSKGHKQWYFQGLDCEERKRFPEVCWDYDKGPRRKTSPQRKHNVIVINNRRYTHLPKPPRRRLTLKDFCTNDNLKKKKCPKVRKEIKSKSRNSSGEENNFYLGPVKRDNGNKDKTIIYTSGAKETDAVVVETNVSTTSGVNADFDGSFCSCTVDKNSIEEMRSSPHGHELLVGNCVPQMLRLPVSGETTPAQLILWQKSEWSKWSSEAQYWIKIQLEPGTAGQMLLPIFLKEELSGEMGKALTIHQLVEKTKNVLNVTTQQSSTEKTRAKPSMGHLTSRVCGASYQVRTVQEAFTTLPESRTEYTVEKRKKIWEMSLTFDGGLLESYELLPTTLTQSVGFGFCATCLRHFDPPLLDGCVLLPCLHYFCVKCWRRYLITKLQQGCDTIPCQDKKCNEVVDEVMIRTLLSCDLANQWLCSRAERTVAMSGRWHWCPEAKCGKVTKLIKRSCKKFPDDNVPVVCDCDRAWCFACLSDVHWPATCDQYWLYRKMLVRNEGLKVQQLLEVKRCPKCQHPVEYRGRCQVVTCKCFHRFYWKESSDHLAPQQNLTMAYYRQSVDHRNKWMALGTYRLTLLGKVIRKNVWRRGSRKKLNVDMWTHWPDLDKLQSSLTILEEVRLLMEHVCVMMSHSRDMFKKSNKVVIVLDQIDFCASTMETIFKCQHIGQEEVERLGRLQTALEGSVKMLSVYAAMLQQTIRVS